MLQFIDRKIRKQLERLSPQRFVQVDAIPSVEYVPVGYKKDNIFPTEGWMPFDTTTRFTEEDEHVYFRMTFHSLPVTEHQTVYFRVRTDVENAWAATNPQGLVYINGKMEQAIDTNHTMVRLEPDTDIELHCYYYTGMHNRRRVNSCFIPELVLVDERVKALYYDVQVPFEALWLVPNDERRVAILKHLDVALNKVNFRDVYSEEYFAGIEAARAYLQEEFYGKECGKSNITVHCIGHTHIDIAWLWTYAQTEEKAQRSFATVLKLMKLYPEYKFMSSQAILYQFVKDNAPELYEEIKQRVAEGRWEVEGAMWLEPDCNLTGGESMVRQILHGKRFMKQEFGVDSEILWLPDTFGYSAAMPQILKKCGVKHFVTSKESWNDTNTIPHDTFLWQGIDGTEILTNFITTQRYRGFDFQVNETTYVGEINPSYALGAWARYHDKEYNQHTITTFGYGDGGGGPTEEMLEYYQRMKQGIPGIPKTEITSARAYLDAVEKEFYQNGELLGRVPRWVGELYLEFHRGTYTSIAKNKRNNRRSELAVAKTELLATIANSLCGVDYPAAELDAVWKLILLNQFHDVLPGSSIHAVYEDSDRQYVQVFAESAVLRAARLQAIVQNLNTAGGKLVFNATSFVQNGPVTVDGQTVELENIPALGWTVLPALPENACVVRVGERSIENTYYRLTFNDDGQIVSFFDKRHAREIVKPGRLFNEFKVFENIPYDYENWEINEFYKEKPFAFGECLGMESVIDGTRAGLKIRRRYFNSTFCQTVWLYSKLTRVDFETELDWHERDQLLKVYFPLNIRANKATYEIQFGNVERQTHQNTSWDAAKFEVCAHKWADVADGSFGVSLLNDCKYGHSCDGSDLSLTILKCNTYPDKEADQGAHHFTYSLLPHAGDFRRETIPAAYGLNQPLEVVEVAAAGGTLPENFSYATVSDPGVVIEALKQAEDGNGTVLRLYECHNACRPVTLSFGVPVHKVELCDMLENPLESLSVSNNTVTLPVGNYEIITLRVR